MDLSWTQWCTSQNSGSIGIYIHTSSCPGKHDNGRLMPLSISLMFFFSSSKVFCPLSQNKRLEAQGARQAAQINLTCRQLPWQLISLVSESLAYRDMHTFPCIPSLNAWIRKKL